MMHNNSEPNSSGMVLVVVVILASVAGILAAGLHFASGSRITQVRQEMRFEKAFFVAEAGIERAKAALRYTNLNSVLTNGVLFGGSNYGEGRFYVTVRDNADSDPSPTVDTDHTVIIRSTGTVETATRIIEVEACFTPSTPGQPGQAPGAVGIYGTNTELTVSGNGKIDGHDWNVPANFNGNGAALNGTLSTNTASAGVFYTSTTTVITADSSATAGHPPITNGTAGVYDEAYWYQYLDSLLPLATLYTGTLGTRAAPTVMILPMGTTTISGNLDGAGILIIPGYANLRITGNFHFEGLVILEGDGVIDAVDEVFQTGTARIFGSMVCVGGGLDIQATGTADIKYSTEALANLANLVYAQQIPAQLEVNSWKEIK